MWILELNLVHIYEAVSSRGGASRLSTHQCLRQSIRKRLQCTGVWFHPESWWVWVVMSFLQIFGSSWLWQGSVPYRIQNVTNHLNIWCHKVREEGHEWKRIKSNSTKQFSRFSRFLVALNALSIGFDVTITINYIPIIFAGWIPYGPPTLRRDATIHPLCWLRGQVRCIETDTQDIEICVLLLGGPNWYGFASKNARK